MAFGAHDEQTTGLANLFGFVRNGVLVLLQQVVVTGTDCQDLRIGGLRKGISLPQDFLSRRGARGILIEGTVSVPENAEYVFTLQTDNAKGSKAFVHLYDIQLIDADKLYKPGTAARSYANVGTENPTGTRGIRLAAGTHKIRIEYVCSAAAQAPSLVLTREKR